MKMADHFKKNKWILLILLVPFVSILLIIQFRHVYIPTNQEIIENIKNTDGYMSNVEYVIQNSRGEYKENVNLYYSRQNQTRLEFENNEVKIYNNEVTSVQKDDYSYEIARDFDMFYPLAFIHSILQSEINEINDGTEEWGDINYLEVDLSLNNKNRHISKAKVYINKEDKTPILTKLYDDQGKERVTIKYNDFKYIE
jgi:outer membrane lipoprotein-sorting protein